MTLLKTIGGDGLLAILATSSSRWFNSEAVISHGASEMTETVDGLKTSDRSSSVARAEKRFGDTNVLIIFTLVLDFGEEDNRFRFIDSDVKV